jgi:hypothetical protein
MNFITILGVIGSALVLIGFVGNRLRYWQSDSQLYVGMNALGSLVLVTYSVMIESWPFVVLNVVWLLFSINGLLKSR